MSPWRRALLGCALGALIVLIAHPISRGVYGCGLWRLGDSPVLEQTKYLPENLGKVRQHVEIDSAADAAYWLAVGGERESEGGGLSHSELLKLVELADHFGRLDQENAFWWQSKAVLLWRGGDMDGARKAWVRGSNAIRWNDYQSLRLKKVVLDLESEHGASMAWHYAYMYYRRSSALCSLIEALARNFKDQSPLTTKEGLKLRFQVLSNGRLLRDNARSILIGRIGVDMVEMASYEPKMQAEQTPFKLVIARRDFRNSLERFGLKQEAEFTTAAFDTNEAWMALTLPERARSAAGDLALEALISDSLPGACTMTALFGLVFYLTGFLLDRFTVLQFAFRMPYAAILGLIVSILSYYLSGLSLSAIWVALCLAAYAVIPSRIRSQPPMDLGPVFKFVVGLLAFVFMILVVLGIMAWCAPGARLSPYLGISYDFGARSPLFYGLVGLVLGIVVILPPAWGVVQRIQPSRIVGQTFRSFGTSLFGISVVLAVVSGPIAVYLDRTSQDVLERLVGNEPTYYVFQ